jgi:nitric oxide reductase NorD protein
MPAELHKSLEVLALADPGLAASVAERLKRKTAPVDPELLDQLVAESLKALASEESFGRAVALGYAELIGEVSFSALEAYRCSLRGAGDIGPTLGRIMAECLPPVIVKGDAETLAQFQRAWAAMARKGSHTLREPLLALEPLLAGGGKAAAGIYLDLLQTLFAQDLSYEEGRYFSSALPKAARGLAAARRCWQLQVLCDAARADRRLIEPFLTGLSRGLGLLREAALREFVDGALMAHRHQRDLGARALALESLAARERFDALQVNVGWAQVQDRLRRYLNARMGLALAIRPLSELTVSEPGGLGVERMVCSGKQAIYVPDEIDRFDFKSDNAELYRLLVRLEACFHEFGTFEFDGEKALERCRTAGSGILPEAELPEPGRSDLDRFFGLFPDPVLAADLFVVFELGRIRKRLEQTYPGLVRRFYPLLRQAFMPLGDGRASPTDLLHRLLARVAFAIPGTGPDAAVDEIEEAFEAGISGASPVEAAAEMTARFFGTGRRAAVRTSGQREPLATPFGWRPWPNLTVGNSSPWEALAERIRAALAAGGLKAYRSDIRRRLQAGSGRLTPEDIRALCPSQPWAAGQVEEILNHAARETCSAEDRLPEDGVVFRYPEWDDQLGDYLPEHVRLQERAAPAGPGGFYEDVLRRYYGLVSQTRQAFERMRPEGLKRLRRWLDGDEFDYRQLVDAAVDRRSGDVPSDRLFIKRVKNRREVAVLLLVDVSRSTANTVPGGAACVLDIEKEAIVVLCEALTVLGDSLAVAGFSGTGRLGVDYSRIKGFGEAMSDSVKLRVGALQPQRNTRMGAAIRHAGRELCAAAARVRLLLILSDGFPNDTDYKGAYAVADTRQALLELRARHIRFHALTVNLPADPKLDQLYGRARHHVISDVRELPGRLLRVYSALTR